MGLVVFWEQMRVVQTFVGILEAHYGMCNARHIALRRTRYIYRFASRLTKNEGKAHESHLIAHSWTGMFLLMCKDKRTVG